MQFEVCSTPTRASARDLRPCEACGETAFRPRFDVTDTSGIAKGTWAVEQCCACGLGRLSPLPTAAQIASFYQGIFYTESGARFKAGFEWIRRGLAHLRGQELNHLAPGVLLDYGSGAGHFGQAMTECGWRVLSIDPYSPKSSHGHLATLGDSGLSLDLPDNSVDAVTLWHVVEHLQNPEQVLRELCRVLRPGGTLLLSQPNFQGLSACLFGRRWLILDPPRHLYQFTPASLTRLCERVGLSIEQIRHGTIELGPFTIMQSALNWVVGNHQVLFHAMRARAPEEDGGRLPFRALRLGVSLLLAPIFLPLAFIFHGVAVALQRGDVFTLLAIKPDAPASERLRKIEKTDHPC